MSKSGGLKILAIVIVALTVLMKLRVISFPILQPYTYWLVVLAFVISLLSDKS